MGILCLANVCADGCAASSDLIGNDGLPLLFERFYKVYNGYCEVHRLNGKFILPHFGSPFLSDVLCLTFMRIKRYNQIMKKLIFAVFAVLVVAFTVAGCGVKSDLVRPDKSFPRNYPVY